MISEALPFGGLWFTTPDDAIEYTQIYSRSHHTVIRVYTETDNAIETHGAQGRFQRVVNVTA